MLKGCGRKIGVFDCCTVVCGDCLELMKEIPDGAVDAVITDPPYGVGLDYGVETLDWASNRQDNLLAFIPLAKRVARFVILPSCRMLELDWIYRKIPPDWLICWYKGSPGTASFVGFNDWEPHLIYGKPSKMMHDYFQALPEPHDNGHPCPKPMAWAEWLISRSTSDGETVLDPFLGSGTTAVAAKKLGRHFLGFEISRTYCDIAEERLRILDQQMKLFPDGSGISSSGKEHAVQLPLQENI